MRPVESRRGAFALVPLLALLVVGAIAGATSAAAAQTTPDAPRVAVIPRLEGAEPLAPAWAEAIASQLSAAAPGRDVRAMAVAAAAECDAACLGARIADAGASLGVLLDVRVQVTRNARSVTVTLSAVAPVSGETLVEPALVAFTDGAPVVALDAIVARMPAPHLRRRVSWSRSTWTARPSRSTEPPSASRPWRRSSSRPDRTR